MRTRPIPPALAIALLISIGACEPDEVTDVTENSANVAGDPDAPLDFDPVVDSAGTQILAEIETPTGSRIQFIEVAAAEEGGVLVVEQGEEGTLVMDRILHAAGEMLEAADLYASLMDPASGGAGIPPRLRELAAPSASSRPIGWALDLIRNEPILRLARANQVACKNSSFTASIPGGFLPKLFKRLDNGPDIKPWLWDTYSYGQVYPRYWYQAFAHSLAWRGKVCGKRGYHPNVCDLYGCSPDFPRATFQYRRNSGQSWVTAGGPVGFGTNLGVVAWYYNGGLGALNWRVLIDRAYDLDEFDVMMSWL